MPMSDLSKTAAPHGAPADAPKFVRANSAAWRHSGVRNTLRLAPIMIAAVFSSALCVGCGERPSDTASPPPSAAAKQDEMRAYLASPEYKKAVQEKLDLMRKEEQIVEVANWFGKTGLPDDTERELPRYLRREYGQSIFDKGALTAADLEYLGLFPDGPGTIHFWRMHDGAKEPTYAYVSVSASGDTVLSWGGRQPPSVK